MKNATCWLALLLVAWTVQGCGISDLGVNVIHPELKPVVNEPVFPSSEYVEPREIHALSTKLERRLVMVGREHREKDNKDFYILTVCAESPPEASQDFKQLSKLSKELSAGLSGGTGGLPETAIKVLTDIHHELSTIASMHFRRSQGLQFYRDAAYQLCQAYMNGIFHEKGNTPGIDFLEELKKVHELATNLMTIEVKQEGFYPAPPMPPKGGPPKKKPKAKAATLGEATTTTTTQSKETITTKTSKGN